jgi:EAL domain-containing protein (putative c-di-GMP-specific phosphodiesterase class I)
MRGLEALARWRHPSLGEIGPGDFVPLAEDTGLAGAMAESFLERVLDQLQVWLTAGRIPARFPVNVNVSARQVHDPAFVPHITSVCRSGRAGTARLGIEITEATLDGRPEETSHVMWRLREAGVTLSLDDFGAGRAALHQLRSTPVDYLKIDRTLTAALTADPVSAEIVRGLVAVASALGVETIAEGVETAEQVRLLRALGCGLGQGFHLAPPVDPDEIRWAEAANAG